MHAKALSSLLCIRCDLLALPMQLVDTHGNPPVHAYQLCDGGPSLNLVHDLRAARALSRILRLFLAKNKLVRAFVLFPSIRTLTRATSSAALLLKRGIHCFISRWIFEFNIDRA